MGGTGFVGGSCCCHTEPEVEVDRLEAGLENPNLRLGESIRDGHLRCADPDPIAWGLVGLWRNTGCRGHPSHRHAMASCAALVGGHCCLGHSSAGCGFSIDSSTY